MQKGSKTGNGIGPTKYEQATCGRCCAQVTLKYPVKRAQEAQPTQGTNTGGMSDTFIPDDKAEPLVLQAGYERRGILLRLLPWLVLIGMIGFVALSLKSCSASDEGEVRVGPMAPEAARTDRVEAQTSQEYRKNLARYSEDKAREALAKGESFVAPAADVRKKTGASACPRTGAAPGPATCNKKSATTNTTAPAPATASCTRRDVCKKAKA